MSPFRSSIPAFAFLARSLRTGLRSPILPVFTIVFGLVVLLAFYRHTRLADDVNLARPGILFVLQFLRLGVWLLMAVGALVFPPMVAAEREEGTLELLRGAGYSTAALYAGLVVPSFLLVLVYALPGLAIFSLSTGLGGVSRSLLECCAYTLLTQLFLLHGLSSLVSVIAPTRRWATFGTLLSGFCAWLLLGVLARGMHDILKDNLLYGAMSELGGLVLLPSVLESIRSLLAGAILEVWRGQGGAVGGFQLTSAWLPVHTAPLVVGLMLHGVAIALFRRGVHARPPGRVVPARWQAIGRWTEVRPARFQPGRVHGQNLWFGEFGAGHGIALRLTLVFLVFLVAGARAYVLTWDMKRLQSLVVVILVGMGLLDLVSCFSRMWDRERRDGVLETLTACPGGLVTVYWQKVRVCLLLPGVLLGSALLCRLASAITLEFALNTLGLNPQEIWILPGFALAWSALALCTRMLWPQVGGMIFSFFLLGCVQWASEVVLWRLCSPLHGSLVPPGLVVTLFLVAAFSFLAVGRLCRKGFA